MPSKVLCVGLCCIDIVQICKEFPREDTDQRSIECHWRRGGSASNNCTVLSLLGADCSFFGNVPDNLFWKYAKENFDFYNIDTSHCVTYDGSYEFPLSTVIVNAQNGSRTIVHSNKNLPEIRADDFSKVDLSQFGWIHIEGRNSPELHKILRIAQKHATKTGTTVSVELEKKRDGILELAQYAKVVFISKDFAAFHGWRDMDTAIEGMKQHIQKGTAVICPWGELGAVAYQSDVGLVRSQSYPPPEVIDTLGAGDTFIAATIFSLSKNTSLERAIDFGCRTAGAKVGGKGFDMIKDAKNSIL
uniref:Carbohydrate kinase PfkB domain-containing protein n=1 Tax=Lygus hesperus TaxID=30085 RepID=A0A0K8S602_LYGHE